MNRNRSGRDNLVCQGVGRGCLQPGSLNHDGQSFDKTNPNPGNHMPHTPLPTTSGSLLAPFYKGRVGEGYGAGTRSVMHEHKNVKRTQIPAITCPTTP